MLKTKSSAVMKHFSLDEVETQIAKILKLADEFAVFSIPIAEECKDDGTEYHHSWLSPGDVTRLIVDGDHKVVGATTLTGDPADLSTVGRELVITTARG